MGGGGRHKNGAAKPLDGEEGKVEFGEKHQEGGGRKGIGRRKEESVTGR